MKHKENYENRFKNLISFESYPTPSTFSARITNRTETYSYFIYSNSYRTRNNLCVQRVSRLRPSAVELFEIYRSPILTWQQTVFFSRLMQISIKHIEKAKHNSTQLRKLIFKWGNRAHDSRLMMSLCNNNNSRTKILTNANLP